MDNSGMNGVPQASPEATGSTPVEGGGASWETLSFDNANTRFNEHANAKTEQSSAEKPSEPAGGFLDNFENSAPKSAVEEVLSAANPEDASENSSEVNQEKTQQIDEMSEEEEEKYFQRLESEFEQIRKNEEAEKANQSRAERKLNSVEARLAEIEKEMNNLEADQEALGAKLDELEDALDENEAKHNSLTTRAEELKTEIRRTKSNIITGFTQGLSLVKNLVLGNHKGVKDLIAKISENVDRNEKALEEQKTNNEAISENDAENDRLIDEHDATLNTYNDNADRLARLRREKAKAERQQNTLREEVEAQHKAAEQAAERNEFLENSGVDTIGELRKKLKDERAAAEQTLQRKIDKLDSRYRDIDDVDRDMMTEEEINAQLEKANRFEEKYRADYEAQIRSIEEQLARADELFPTMQEKVKNLSNNASVKTAFSSFTRKVVVTTGIFL